MSYPLVRFVDAPDPTASVRYDFNRETGAAPRRVARNGLSLGSPVLSGEPDAAGAAFGFRRPSVQQRIYGPKQDALQALSSLSRELLRPTNWLFVQWDAFTGPVWLKVYRSEYAPLSLDQVHTDTDAGDPVTDLEDVWQIDVPLVADAFAYGPWETHDAVAVSQGPSGNALRYQLPAIKGDAPTPLRIKVDPASTAEAGSGSKWLIGVISGDAADPCMGYVKNIGGTDGVVAGTDLSASAANANRWDGNHRSVSFSTDDDLVQRLQVDWTDVKRGRYKMFARVAYDGSFDVFHDPSSFQLAGGQVTDLTAYWNLPVMWPEAGFGLITATDPNRVAWVDLGEQTFPFGFDAPQDANIPTGTVTPALKVARTQGIQPLEIDALLLIPVAQAEVDSVTSLRSTFLWRTLQNNRYATWDGDDETVWLQLVSDDSSVDTKPELTGGFPVVDPAAAVNVLWCFAQESGIGIDGSTNMVTDVAVSHDVTVAYRPRYLHLGDGS